MDPRPPNCFTQGPDYCTGAFTLNAEGKYGCSGKVEKRETGWHAGKMTVAACAHACRKYGFFTLDTATTLTGTATSTHQCRCSDTCEVDASLKDQTSYKNSLKPNPNTAVDCWIKRGKFCTGSGETLTEKDYDEDGIEDPFCEDNDGTITALLSSNVCAKTYLPAKGDFLATKNQPAKTMAFDSADRRCDECPTGKYSTSTNSLECKDHSICALDEYILAFGTSKADVQCAQCNSCKSGKFRPTFCLDYSTGKEVTNGAKFPNRHPITPSRACSEEFYGSSLTAAAANEIVGQFQPAKKPKSERMLNPMEGCMRGGSVGGGTTGQNADFGCRPCKKCNAKKSACTSVANTVCADTAAASNGGVCDKKSKAYNKETCKAREDEAKEKQAKMREEEEK